MQAEQVYRSFVETAKHYLKELDFYGKAQFKMQPIKDFWSVGQLYEHLLNSSYTIHLKEIKDCLAKRNGEKGGKKTFKGKFLFRFRKTFFTISGISQDNHTPTQPEDPKKIQDDLYRFLKVMNQTAGEIDSSADLTYKTRHPDLGMLNAVEWFTLIDIHFKRHLKLKKKLDPFVRSMTKELAAEEE